MVGGEEAHAAMEAAFEEALRHDSSVAESSYRFAGRVASVRVAGQRLAADIDLPFAHLHLSSGGVRNPHLRVDLWDQAFTGVPCPLPSPTQDLEAPGTIEPSPDGRFVTYRRAGTQFSFDRARRHLVGWVSDTDHLTQFERGRPFMGPLHLWHQDRDVHAVHAGLVSSEGRGVLFGGAGGVGKTTSALMCLDAGFTYLSDDYVGLETRDDGHAIGHSVFCSTHVAPKHLVNFPFLVPHARPGKLSIEDKSLVFLSEVVPERLGRKTDLRVIVLPRVAHQDDTTFRRASRAEALFRLAPSSVFLQRASLKGKRALDKLEHLVRHTPAYCLDLGKDPRVIPERVGEILEQVAS